MRFLILFFLLLSSNQAFSCTDLPYEERLELAHSVYNSEVNFVKEVANKADLIFVATFLTEKLREPERKDADNYYFIEVDKIKLLKGDFYSNIHWIEEYSDVLSFGCHSDEVDKSINLYSGYKYLFYVRGGEILRAKLFEQHPYLSETEELKMIFEAVDAKESN